MNWSNSQSSFDYNNSTYNTVQGYSIQQGIQYIQAYIYLRKGVRVNVIYPQTQRFIELFCKAVNIAEHWLRKNGHIN